MTLKRKKFELGKLPTGGKSGKYKGKVPMDRKYMTKIGSGKQTFKLGKIHTTKGGASSLGKLLGKSKVELKIYQAPNGKARIVIPKRVTFNIKKATR
jgi:hypothetical protein